MPLKRLVLRHILHSIGRPAIPHAFQAETPVATRSLTESSRHRNAAPSIEEPHHDSTRETSHPQRSSIGSQRQATTTSRRFRGNNAQIRRLQWRLFYYETRGGNWADANKRWQECVSILGEMSQQRSSDTANSRELLWLKDAIKSDDRNRIAADLFQHTGCEMQMPSETSTILLQGTSKQVQAAKAYFASRHELAGSVPATQPMEWQQVRPVLDRKFRSPMSLPDALSASNSKLSATDLDVVVSTLVRKYGSQAIAAVRGARGQRRMVEIVSAALVRILTRPENLGSATAASARQAFTYLARHRRSYTVDAIVSAFQAQGGEKASEITAEAHASVLESSALVQDIDMFLSRLQAIRSMNLPADRRTWRSFHRLTMRCFPNKLRDLEYGMMRLGLLNSPGIVADILTPAIPQRLQSALDARESTADDLSFIKDFMANVSSALPTKWLTQSSAQSVIALLLREGLWENAYQVLLEGELTYPASRPCWEMFLKAASGRNQHDPAVVINCLIRLDQIFHQQNSRHRRMPPYSDKVFQRLFDFAFHGKHWNLLRAIWLHACSAQKLTKAMRSRMRQHNRPTSYAFGTDVSSQNRLWHMHVANFVMASTQEDDSLSPYQRFSMRLEQVKSTTLSHSLAFDAANAMRQDEWLRDEGIWPTTSPVKSAHVMQIITSTAYSVDSMQPTVRTVSIAPVRRIMGSPEIVTDTRFKRQLTKSVTEAPAAPRLSTGDPSMRESDSPTHDPSMRESDSPTHDPLMRESDSPTHNPVMRESDSPTHIPSMSTSRSLTPIAPARKSTPKRLKFMQNPPTKLRATKTAHSSEQNPVQPCRQDATTLLESLQSSLVPARSGESTTPLTWHESGRMRIVRSDGTK